MAGSLELGSLTALPLRGLSASAAQGQGPQVDLLPCSSFPFSRTLTSLCSSFPGDGDWASGGAICPVFAQPFDGNKRILQVCRPLLFPSSVPDGAPRTLTILFVFGSESSYIRLPSNFDFVCKNYRVYMCTPISYAGPAPDLCAGAVRFPENLEVLQLNSLTPASCPPLMVM